MKGKWKGRDTVESNARKQLPRLAIEYFQAGANLWTTAKSPEDLHQFRLLTKHFRYTLELFEKQYDRQFGLLLKKLKPVQDALGEINDAATALNWLKTDECEPAREFLQARIRQKIAGFERYWATTFDRQGARERWAAVLQAPVGAEATAPADGGRSQGRRSPKKPVSPGA